MIDDMSTLLWLEWKRLRVNARYGLSLVGFMEGLSRTYMVYAALFWAFWLFAMWGFVIDQVYQLSRDLQPETGEAIIQSLPAAILLLQLVALFIFLRDPVLKITASDIAYTTTAPVRRGTLILVWCARSFVIPALLVALAHCWLAMLLTWATASISAGWAGFQAFLVAFPLVYLSGAAIWALVLLKMRPIRTRRKRLLWLSIPALLIGALVWPQFILWPGHVSTMTVDGQLSGPVVVELLAGCAIAFTALVLIGNRVHMGMVADASQMYARIHRLGVIGTLEAGDVIARIKRQAKLSRKTRLYLSLPERTRGGTTLLARSTLSLLRLSPGSVFRRIIEGMSLSTLVTTIVLIGGWQRLQTWVLVMLVLSQTSRSLNLVELLRQDMERPFLRQFLPGDNLTIFVADSVVSIGLASLGGSLAVLLLPFSADRLAGMVLVVLAAVVLSLCQALDLTNDYGLPGLRIPYEYMIILCTGLIVLAGSILNSLMAAAMAALFLCVTLAALLRASR